MSIPDRTVSNSPATTNRLTRRKLWLFRGTALVMVVGVIELVSWFVWMTFPPIKLTELKGQWKSVAELGTERTTDLEVLHPYLGWAFNPDAAEVPDHAKGVVTVNALGFADTAPTIRKRSADRFIIAICGGSVAQQMSTIGEQDFRKLLESSPQLRGKQIEIVRLAMSGYKQPQHLMALNYAMVLGGEFDVVINIDGYNETGLTVGENELHQVFAAYPRAWQARLQDVVDPRNASTSYQLLEVRATRQARAQWISQSWLRHTWTGSLAWASQDSLLRSRQIQLGVDLVENFRKRGHGFARQGPRQMYSNESEMYQHVTALWSNSSLQMHFLCAGQGIPYLHFLQPNQYHEGSKPLSPKELESYYSPQEYHAIAVKQGYPKLIEAGKVLRERGVDFHDLTQLFSKETDTIYSDYFCHYNPRGTGMLSKAVSERILHLLPMPQ
jgi:uncharacterized protein with GYD domain